MTDKKILLMHMVVMFALMLIVIPINAMPSVDIDINNSFKAGETIGFEFTIVETEDNKLIEYFSDIECESAPTPQPELRTVELLKGIRIKEKHVSIKIDDSVEPQVCTSYVEIVSPESFRFEKNFSIISDPSFSFTLLTCKDASCAEESKVFLSNEYIHMDYNSDVESPSINVVITYPDGTTQQTVLPTSIKADQIGTYQLDAVASKTGYKEVIESAQFGVIEAEAGINTTYTPGSELHKDKIEEKLLVTIISILIVAFILIALSTLIIFNFRNNNKTKTNRYMQK
jgi:hypothetical protein